MENKSIGTKIKALRTSRSMTLKQLSEASGLSVGFLSQLERGMSSIAIDSLIKITRIFEIDLATFFEESGPVRGDPVVHGFELSPTYISPLILQYVHSHTPEQFGLLPRVFVLMPFANMDDALEMYAHNGEEFIYVLEGIVTVYMDEMEYTLYPGDSIQINSNRQHNWTNRTGKIARILTVNLPNPLQSGSEPTAD